MNVAVIGIGKLGQRHLDKWAEIDGVTVVGVIARRDSELKRISDQYGTLPYKSIEELLAEQPVDVIDICTPTHTHYLFIQEAARAGIDIICEKPIALTFQEAEKAMKYCRRHQVQLFVAHTLEFFPVYEMTKRFIHDGRLGKTVKIKLARGVPYPADARAWYVDVKKSGGLFLDLGVHEFEWLLTTFGDVIDVSTRNVRFSPADEKTVIYGVVQLQFVNGITAEIELSWDEPAFRASFEMSGETGTLTYRHVDEAPVFTDHEGMRSRPELFRVLSPIDPYIRQLSHFKRCIEGQEEPILSYTNAAKAVQIAELATKSVTEGVQKVDLN